MTFQVAETVGRPVFELGDMPLSEVLEWNVYLRLKNEKEKAAYEEAERKAKLKR